MPEDRKQRKRDQQTRDILKAAREFVLRDGSANLTMRKLAKEVGCAPGTLYLYFQDKDVLVASLVEESFEHLTEDLDRAGSHRDPLAALEAMMRAYIAFGLTNPEHYGMAFGLRRTQDLEKMRPRPHRSFDLLVEAVRSCVEQARIAPVDIQLAAQSLWAGMHGITSLLITIPKFPWCDQESLIDRTVNTLLEGLRPSPRAVPDTEGDSNDDTP